MTKPTPNASEKGRTAQLFGQFIRQLSVWHRWAGIVLCLFFCVWFLTGAMMVFVPFPSLGAADRDAHAEIISFDRVRVAPAQALAGEKGSGLRLVSRAGQPVYVINGAKLSVLGAATGAPVKPLSPDQARQIAEHFSGSSARSVSAPFNYDQWVVHQQFDPWRPFFRIALKDKAQTELYVSQKTGEIVQKTTATQRVLNWLGAVIHWMYVTPLRRTFWVWDQTVWWISLAGLLTAIAGITLGITRSSKALKNPKRPRLTPFRGWLEWHHKLGLFAGVLVLMWIFSGWLSMDHGRLFSKGEAPAVAQTAYQGADLTVALATISAKDLSRYQGATRLDFNAIAGQPVIAEGSSKPAVMLNDQVLLTGVRAGWPNTAPDHLDPVAPTETFALAEGLSATTRLAHLKDHDHTNVYIDGVTGKILVVMNTSRKAYAWVYYAIHTWNYPFLSDRPILHNTLVLMLLLAGFSFSLTSLIIGIKRLRLTFSKI